MYCAICNKGEEGAIYEFVIGLNRYVLGIQNSPRTTQSSPRASSTPETHPIPSPLAPAVYTGCSRKYIYAFFERIIFCRVRIRRGTMSRAGERKYFHNNNNGVGCLRSREKFTTCPRAFVCVRWRERT